VSGHSRWLSGAGVGLAGGWGPVRWVVDAARAAKRYSQGAVLPRLWSSDGGASRRRGRDSADLTGDCQAFRGTLDAKVIVRKPADPEANGLTERANAYLETSFLPTPSMVRTTSTPSWPGGCRRRTPPDADAGLLAKRSGSRRIGPRCSPCHRSRR
jgi:hypothetical protein